MDAAHSRAAAARAIAAQVIARVVLEGRYLDTALEEARAGQTNDAANFPLVQELAYGTLRWYHQLAGISALFLSRPFKRKDTDVHALLLTGFYQLRYMRVADHAAVDTTVSAAERLNKAWSKGVLNACLRAYQRETERVDRAIDASMELRYSHPSWLIDAICRDYPNDWKRVLEANNERPPMTLRVNTARIRRDEYQATLAARGIAARPHASVESALVLAEPLPVEDLPGFVAGQVSVQDAAAQLAAVLLDAEPTHRVLDACAAPGGKAAHILERTPAIRELVALDVDVARLARVRDNFARLGLTARVVAADATDPARWWDGVAFDRILLDVPCSATGVIRRHPDIKVRRRHADLVPLRETQDRLLDAVWPCLAPGGKLLYATCSILDEENAGQVNAFLRRHADAALERVRLSTGRPGGQILPGQDEMDGFYYACVRKR
ncbi:MAG: 16S rRNA (cytosine(967)-C(5))-methyltransferase RsmB [Sulfurifustis sp.]